MGYGRAQILYDVSFHVGAGEVVVLLGRNGAGKSTTLKTLAGLLQPWRGEVRFDGTRIDGLPAYRIARLGIGYCSAVASAAAFPAASSRCWRSRARSWAIRA